MSSPDFFIVGQPKCGTSAFYDFLGQHPDVFLPEHKEPHFFCSDFHEESRRHHGRLAYFQAHTEEQYLALFKEWAGQRRIGEASVHYLYSKVAAEEIHRFNPTAQIIVFLRHPVEFLYSWHSYAMLGDGEHLESFEKALDAEDARKRGEGLTPYMKVPSKLFYSERVKFTEQLNRFIARFGRRRVHIVFHEDLRRNAAEEYRKVLEFLDIDPSFVPVFGEVNQNKRLRFPAVARATKLPVVRQVSRALLPPRIRTTLGLPAVYRKLFLVEKKRAPLSEATRLRLVEQTLPEVRALSELLERDLVSFWNYNSLRDRG